MLQTISVLALALAPIQSIPDDTPSGAPELAGVADETGLTALTARLGGAVPTGAGLYVAQAEAPSGGAYKPDTNHAEFAGKTFKLKSGASGASGHATTVGRYFYGLVTGVAPGPGDIDCYSASGFLGGNFLRGAGALVPKTANWKIENNSWIGGGSNAYLRKLDWVITQQGLVVCSGTNNGAGPLDVPLFSHVFNGIAVGRSDGNHRAGGTLGGYDTGGRQKPEMVAPASATSYATPLVSGGAALLVETARTHPGLAGNPAAELPEVVKAALMAGAEHRAGWANDAPQSGPSRGLATKPLDPVFGVDELDVNRSHWILTGGEHAGAASAAAAQETRHNGWDHLTISEGESRFWRFQVLADKPYASVLVTWNRYVAPDFLSFAVPKIDLELFAVDGGGGLVSLVGDPGLAYFAAGNARSASTKDNLEHLYLTALAPGEYVLEVARASDGEMPFEAAVAWELSCAPPFAYGAAKTTSSGLAPAMGWRGIPSAAEDDFDVTVANAEPGKSGIFFYGSGQLSKPFYGGTKLVAPPVVRTPVTTTDSAGAATLTVSIDPTMVGQQRNYQFWFRDPTHPDGTNVGISDAVEVVFCP